MIVSEGKKTKRVRDIHFKDKCFAYLMKFSALSMVFLLGLICYYLYQRAFSSIYQFGLNFLMTSQWNPVTDVYGALPIIFGTLFISFVAILIAAPISIGVALYLSELAPPALGKFFGFLVEMLAAIPSVVYGLWGIFVLVPWLRSTVEPFLSQWFSFLPLFRGSFYGVSQLAAAIILAIMIIPTISSLSRELFRSIPRLQKEAAYALGATRWEMLQLSVLRSANNGVWGAIILGLGRALGETMAVTMVIGNRAHISFSLFEPGQTMASVIANEYAEATSNLHLAALAEVGLVLFAVTFIIKCLFLVFIRRPQTA